MALPLFNRNASPDVTRNMLFESYYCGNTYDVNLDLDFDMDMDMFSKFSIVEDHEYPTLYYPGSPRPYTPLPNPESQLDYCAGIPVLADSPSSTPASSRSHSGSMNHHHDVNYLSSHHDNSVGSGQLPQHPGLLAEISDKHIPQPRFSIPSTCPFPDCKTTTLFTTGRDFRRHYRQHFKRFFCRYKECPQSIVDLRDPGKRGFATRKDRARHEAKHNPAIQCPYQDVNGEPCKRTFSRMDNMRDHCRRIHEKRQIVERQGETAYAERGI